MQSELVLRKLIQRLIREQAEAVDDVSQSQVNNRVVLISESEVANWQFPVWFQRMLQEDGVVELTKFNKLMYQVYDELRDLHGGPVLVYMFQSQSEDRFKVLYCSLLNEINPEMTVEEVVEIVKEIMASWLQDENHNELWKCLTGKSNQAPEVKPEPVKNGLGSQPRLLPRYETDDLKQLVEEATQILRLNEQQYQILQRQYLKLTVTMNELYHVKKDKIQVDNTLEVLKFLLGDTLSSQQQKITARGGSNTSSQNQQLKNKTGDLLDDDQIQSVINTNKLVDPLTEAEQNLIETSHDTIMKAVPNLSRLYDYVEGKKKFNEIADGYEDVKETVSIFLRAGDFAQKIKEDSNLKVFIKFLVLLLGLVEDKYEEEKSSQKSNVGNSSQALGGELIAVDNSLGDNSIHADQNILNDFVSKTNLLNRENFVKSHVNLELLRQDGDFTKLYPQAIMTLQQWSKRLEGLKAQDQNDLMEKYSELISKTYRHYEKLLDKLRDGYFFDPKFDDEKGKNDIPQFLYQLLYYYEKLVKKMPEGDIAKFGQSMDEETGDIQQEVTSLLEDFDLEQFKEEFTLNNSEEINEIVKPNLDIIDRIFKKDLAQYQDVMNKRHPDFKKLKAFVDQFKKIIDQNNNEKIAEDLFKVFKDSLGDYLSLRKKARAGIFNYVKRYGNVVKIAVYYLLCKWELSVLKLEEKADIEEMVEDLDIGAESELSPEDADIAEDEDINENFEDVYKKYQVFQKEGWFKNANKKNFAGLKKSKLNELSILSPIEELINMGVVTEPAKLLRNKDNFLLLCDKLKKIDENIKTQGSDANDENVKLRNYVYFFIKRYIDLCIKLELFPK